MTERVYTPPDLKWLASFSASCLHAADAARRGQLIADSRIAAAIEQPARNLRRAVAATGLPAERVWSHLLGLSAEHDNNQQLMDLALKKVAGSGGSPAVAALAGHLADLEAAIRDVVPDLVDELALRGRPLQEQWEARGPGMLRTIAHWTDARVIPPRAEVVLVQPIRGGGGCACLDYNRVLIEAVLTHPYPTLPEPVRLAWMIGQLQLDLPVFSDHVHRDHLPLVSALSMLPPALKAAEHVELASCDPATARLAVQAWQLPVADADATLDVLWQWWETYLEARPAWPVAITALDRMLEKMTDE